MTESNEWKETKKKKKKKKKTHSTTVSWRILKRFRSLSHRSRVISPAGPPDYMRLHLLPWTYFFFFFFFFLFLFFFLEQCLGYSKMRYWGLGVGGDSHGCRIPFCFIATWDRWLKTPWSDWRAVNWVSGSEEIDPVVHRGFFPLHLGAPILRFFFFFSPLSVDGAPLAIGIISSPSVASGGGGERAAVEGGVLAL